MGSTLALGTSRLPSPTHACRRGAFLSMPPRPFPCLLPVPPVGPLSHTRTQIVPVMPRVSRRTALRLSAAVNRRLPPLQVGIPCLLDGCLLHGGLVYDCWTTHSLRVCGGTTTAPWHATAPSTALLHLPAITTPAIAHIPFTRAHCRCRPAGHAAVFWSYIICCPILYLYSSLSFLLGCHSRWRYERDRRVSSLLMRRLFASTTYTSRRCLRACFTCRYAYHATMSTVRAILVAGPRTTPPLLAPAELFGSGRGMWVVGALPFFPRFIRRHHYLCLPPYSSRDPASTYRAPCRLRPT